MFLVWLLGVVLYTSVDALWLAVIAKGFMVRELGPLLSDSPRYWAAGLFYLIHIAGLLVFVIQPYQSSMKLLFMYGAFFGFLVYAGFDFTCLAVFKNFSVQMAAVDLLWGSILNGVMAVLILKTAQVVGISHFYMS